MNRVSVLAILLAVLAAPVHSQNPEPAKSQTRKAPGKPSKDEPVRISVTLVQVDAVVTDSKGRLVKDLKPEDFEILEDGRPQRITNFSYISTEAPQPETRTPAPRPDKLAPPLPPTPLRPDQVKRTIALVIDDLGLSFESMAYTREALRKFVDQQMEPGDLVAIIRSGAGIGALQQFTSDKSQLYAAIERLRWNFVGTGGIGAFQPITPAPLVDVRLAGSSGSGRAGMGENNAGSVGAAGARGGGASSDRNQANEELDELREQLFSVGTLGAVGYVVRGLKELPGRKSVVLISDGFRIFSTDQLNDRVIQALKLLTDQANRASVVIYCLDARGLPALGLSAADDVSGLSVQQVQELISDRRRGFYESQEGLIYLARTTGGFAITNSNDLAAGLHGILEDQKGYYLIGYIPDDTTFKPVAGHHVFHKVAVKVKGAGLRVRSRTGFYGAEDEEARPAPVSREQQLAAALTSPFTSGGVGVRLTTLFGNSPKSSYLSSLMYIDPSDLTFTAEPDGSQKATLDVVAMTFGDNGRVVDQASRTDTLRVKDEARQLFLDQGLLYTITLPVKKPGAYQLRVAVRDAASERIGSANQFVAVPDLNKGRLAVSGLLLSGKAPAGGATNASRPGGSDGVQGAVPDGGQAGNNVSRSGPALRIFRRGKDQDLEYTIIVYNARIDKGTGRPQLESQVRLFKDGKQVYASPFTPMRLSDAHNGDWKRIPTGGSMHLTHDQEPGQYVLQMVVRDNLAKEKYRTATQWIDFEVVE